MLRRNVYKGIEYTCALLGVTVYNNPVVVVTSSAEPTADLYTCQLPLNWEWVFRR